MWRTGDLFHAASRFPRRRDVPKVDRLAGILQSGLIAPARCPDGLVCSDLRIIVTGYDVPYDSLIFLHRVGPQSYFYIPCEPGRFAVLVDPRLPVLTPGDMGANWLLLCMDEVYVRDRIAVERIIGVAVHPAEADAVLEQFRAEFRRLAIPLYDFEGTVRWPPQR
jgi:hypothetical protein